MEKGRWGILKIFIIVIILATVIYLVNDLIPTRTSREIDVLMSFISIAIVVIVIVFFLRFDWIVDRYFKK